MAERDAAKPATGPTVIAGYLGSLPGEPGVYRMLDAQGAVLYVGKARDLRKRVAAYAKLTGHSARIARMIRETASMMFLTTATETEALLLEQNLIKQLKPRYNVLLRDDKSFPNILVTGDHPFPQIKKHRGAKKEKGRYYGPFASAGAVNRTLNQLQKVFLLRSCSDSVFEARTRPCLLYQIKRCAAPCVGSDRCGGICKAGRRRRAVPAGPIDRCRRRWPPRWPQPRMRWNTNAPQRCATGSAR
jgi:excinuclease ABC subunit C